MTVRRDHVAAIALGGLGVVVFLLGFELPFGTPASPGPGMMPYLCAGLLIALAAVVLVHAGASPPLASIAWDDVPHAVRVMSAATAAAALYTTLGFPLTFFLLLLGLMWGIERMPLAISLAIAAGMSVGTWQLLGALLKSPMPPGIFGF